jgi:hypothetical protein
MIDDFIVRGDPLKNKLLQNVFLKIHQPWAAGFFWEDFHYPATWRWESPSPKRITHIKHIKINGWDSRGWAQTQEKYFDLAVGKLEIEKHLKEMRFNYVGIFDIRHDGKYPIFIDFRLVTEFQQELDKKAKYVHDLYLEECKKYQY